MKGNTDIPQGSPAEAPLNPEPAMLQLAEYVRMTVDQALDLFPKQENGRSCGTCWRATVDRAEKWLRMRALFEGCPPRSQEGVLAALGTVSDMLQMSGKELEFLMGCVVDKEPSTFLEIGRCTGYSAYAVLTAMSWKNGGGRCFVSVDRHKWKVTDDVIVGYAERCGIGRCDILVGDSRGIDLSGAMGCRRIDACLIDGSHRFSVVESDVKRFGLASQWILMHDCLPEENRGEAFRNWHIGPWRAVQKHGDALHFSTRSGSLSLYENTKPEEGRVGNASVC